MHLLIRSSALCALFALAACGPGNEQAAAPRTESAQRAQSTTTAAAYNAPVQGIYIAYFGRPADPAGLAWFTARFADTGVKPDVASIAQAYNANAAVRAQVDAFSQSAESAALYPGDNRTFITAIYNYLFNRQPDSAGLEYWIGQIGAGIVTRGGAAIAIMSGAQAGDAAIIGLKNDAATRFTTSLNTEERRKKYDGLGANLVARQLLSGVTSQAGLDAFLVKADASLDYMTGTVATDANFNITSKVTRNETATQVKLGAATMYCVPPGDVGESDSFIARIKLDPVKQTATMEADGELYSGSYNFKDGSVHLKVDYPFEDPLGSGVYTAWGSAEFNGVYDAVNGKITGAFIDHVRIKWTLSSDQLTCSSYGDITAVKVP